MNIGLDFDVDCSAERLFSVLSDLGSMQRWTDVARSVQRSEPRVDDLGPAWNVVLAAKVGPVRQKVLVRMVQVICESPASNGRYHVRFEGKIKNKPVRHPLVIEHWIEGDEVRASSSTEIHLRGGIKIPFLDRFLGGEIDSTVDRVRELAQQG